MVGLSAQAPALQDLGGELCPQACTSKSPFILWDLICRSGSPMCVLQDLKGGLGTGLEAERYQTGMIWTQFPKENTLKPLSPSAGTKCSQHLAASIWSGSCQEGYVYLYRDPSCLQGGSSYQLFSPPQLLLRFCASLILGCNMVQVSLAFSYSCAALVLNRNAGEKHWMLILKPWQNEWDRLSEEGLVCHTWAADLSHHQQRQRGWSCAGVWSSSLARQNCHCWGFIFQNNWTCMIPAQGVSMLDDFIKSGEDRSSASARASKEVSGAFVEA